MGSSNHRRIAGFGRQQNPETGGSGEKPAKPSFADPRITAFTGAYTYQENRQGADAFFTMSDLRKMFSAWPTKNSDPLPALLEKLEKEGYCLQMDEADRMGMPVRRIYPLSQLKQTNDD
ncbi:MAG: hypothetical protein LBQ65_09720 [Tannerellaceae bacterium]|jgi:hypothetical protein|nr:hypothetical protein [Tannerellaceae bacterium]